MLFGNHAGTQLWAVALAADGSAVSSWPPPCVDDPVKIAVGLTTPCVSEPPTTAVGLGVGRAYPVLTKSTATGPLSGGSISAVVVRYHSLYYLFFTGTDRDTGAAVVYVGLSATPLEPYVDFNGAGAGAESLAPTVVLASESPRYEQPTGLGAGVYMDDENLAQFVLSFQFSDSTDNATKLGGSATRSCCIRTAPPTSSEHTQPAISRPSLPSADPARHQPTIDPSSHHTSPPLSVQACVKFSLWTTGRLSVPRWPCHSPSPQRTRTRSTSPTPSLPSPMH